MSQFVDWDLAAATAAKLASGGPRVTPEDAAAVVVELRELSERAEQHVLGFTQMPTSTDRHAPVRVVDRADWAAANVAGLRAVMTPLVERLTEGRPGNPAMRAVGSRVTAVQTGTVLAFLSSKVLGQYEVFSSDPGQLLLVAPNIVEIERKLGAVPRDFRLWVCLHEVTHRLQFVGVPWLREYFFAEVGAFVDAGQLDGDQLMERLRRGFGAVADVVRDPESRSSLLDIVQTPAQREVLDRLTALMSLLEGHAEFVMDGVGPSVVPTVTAIREKFNQRRRQANPVEKLLRRLLGVELKMRQYAEGQAFVSAVVGRVGIEGFNRVWESAETLPTLAEIVDPPAWVARVHA